MVRPQLVRAFLVGLALLPGASPLAARERAWPVPRGPSREPNPYRYDPKVLRKVPRVFLDDAAAAVLYAGNTHLVDKDGTIESITHDVTRLNGRKGVEKLGEYRNITFTPSYQKLTLNEARIHKANGKVIDVEPRHAHLRDVATDYQVYDPEKQLIITFPSLEVGDTIEVKWTIRGKNPEHAGQFFHRYSFGDVLYPVVRDEFRVRLPRDRALKYASAHGAVDPAINEAGEHKLFSWAKVNCPRQPRDDDMPSKEELRPSLMVSTFTSWDEVGQWKAKLRAQCWKCTPEVEKAVKEVVKGIAKPEDKARALTYWVRRNVRYVSVGDKHDYTPHPPGKVLANRYGDCKDTSQLLAVMLREVGIKVELATLGALDDGQINKDVPSPWGTHAILLATIDGKEHWIDTTAQLAGWDFLPRDDLDRVCYLTDEKGKARLHRTPKPAPERNRIEQLTDVWVGADGTSRCYRTVTSSGSAAISQRDSYVETPPGERRRQLAAELQDSNSRTRLVRLDVDEKALRDHDQPVTVKMEFEIPKHFTGSPDREGSVTDSKVWGKLLSHNIDHDRKSPLVLPLPVETIHRYRFHLPAAYELDGVPRNKTVRSAWGSFTVRCRALDDSDGGIRHAEVAFHLRIEKPRVEADDLEAFRRFHEDVNRDYRVWLTLKPVSQPASIPLLEQLLAVSPQNGFAAVTLARLYLKAGKQADAARVLDRACYYTPDETTPWELRVQAAENAAAEEKAQRELVKRFPGEPRYALGLGTTLVTLGKQPEARTLLQSLTTRGASPLRASAHYQLARSHYRKDELKEALAQLDAAAKEDAETVNTLRAWTLRGQVLEELKRPGDAIGAYKKALALEKGNQSSLLSLIRLSLVTNDRPAALDYLRRYTLTVEKDVSGLLLAAQAYMKLRHYDEALELASRSRDIAFHEKAQRILGLIYLLRRDDAGAVRHLEKAEPDSVVLAGLIRATINLGKVRDLETWLDKAGRIDKPSEGLRRASARARKLLDRRAELTKLVTVPAGKEAEYAPALDALACAEEAYGAREPAARVAALLAPACKPGLSLGPALALRGRLALDRGKLRLALADAEKAIALSPRDARGYLVRGRVKLEREAAGALADLEKAAELSGRKDADALQALAEALAAAGRHADAVAAQKEAVKLRPKDRELLEQLAALEKTAREKGGR
jgi:tetratricopeptide (TPR) repeat protein/transglutaminase-like putative cysteine protease